MRCITNSEFVNWCGKNGINVPLSGAADFEQGNNYRVITETPTYSRTKKAILRELFEFYEKGSDFYVQLRCWNEASLDGGVVDLILALRRQHGEARHLSEAPVHLFSAKEVELCLGFIDLVLAFDWEAVWLPTTACNVIWAQVDEHLILVANERELFQKITKQMSATGTVFKEF